jgi:hypothetical protein
MAVAIGVLVGIADQLTGPGCGDAAQVGTSMAVGALKTVGSLFIATHCRGSSRVWRAVAS